MPTFLDPQEAEKLNLTGPQLLAKIALAMQRQTLPSDLRVEMRGNGLVEVGALPFSYRWSSGTEIEVSNRLILWAVRNFPTGKMRKGLTYSHWSSRRVYSGNSRARTVRDYFDYEEFCAGRLTVRLLRLHEHRSVKSVVSIAPHQPNFPLTWSCTACGRVLTIAEARKLGLTPPAVRVKKADPQRKLPLILAKKATASNA